MNRRKKATNGAGIVGVVLAGFGLLALLLSNTLAKNWLIICLGIRVFRTVLMAEIAIVGVGVIILIISAIPFLKNQMVYQRERKQAQARQQQKAQFWEHYAENDGDPELIRKRLNQLWREMPALDALIRRCLNQMDQMDDLQARQEVLIKSNGALYLKDTVEVLNNVERRICRNLRSIINFCIVEDDPTQIAAPRIEKILADNELKLSDSKELLKVSAEWINQYDSGFKSDFSEVESWISTIRESLKED